MATGTNMAQLPGLPSWGQGWLDSYLAQADGGDVVRGDVGRGARWWHHLFDGVATLTEGRLQRLQDRVGRQVAELGTAFRLPGDTRERRWPLPGCGGRLRCPLAVALPALQARLDPQQVQADVPALTPWPVQAAAGD